MSHRAVAGAIVALVAGSGQSIGAQAHSAAVEVSLVSVVPGTSTINGDWCIGTANQVVLTAHALDLASQSEVTEGTIVWQVCGRTVKPGILQPLPKEDCDVKGSTRWGDAAITDLSFQSPATLLTFPDPAVPIKGWRLQYRPAPGSNNFKRATSQPFNLDQTCPP